MTTTKPLADSLPAGMIYSQNQLCGELLCQYFQFSEFSGFSWRYADYSSFKGSLIKEEELKTVIFMFDEIIPPLDSFRQDISQIPKETMIVTFVKKNLLDERWIANIETLSNVTIIDQIPTLAAMKECLLCEYSDPQDEQESNQKNLSSRETEILKLIGTGLTNKEIAKRLYISFYTVETHRKNIVRKLNVRHGELVRYAVKVSNGFA
jgi:DNA-binding CsgD family transcriptional regulator